MGVSIDTVGPIVNKEETEAEHTLNTILALLPLSWFYGCLYISQWEKMLRLLTMLLFLV